jgi:CRP-like cAMP-binding protein
VSLDDDIRNLGRIPFFSELEVEAQRLIAFAAEMKILRAGDVLFRRGEKSDGGFIVQSGSIALDGSDNGSPSKQIVAAHGLIGEIALLTETERPATAIAREPTTVLRVPRVLFHRVLREFPVSAQRLRQSLTGRLTEFVGELEGMNRDADQP